MGSTGTKESTYTKQELANTLEDWQTHYFSEMRAIDRGEWDAWKDGYSPEDVKRIEKDYKILTQFLKNQPKYEGEVERGLAFGDKEELDDFLKANKVGSIITSDSIESWTTKRGEGSE